MIESAWSGDGRRVQIEASDFFALALSASGGRAVVRDYLETSVPRAKKSLADWFRFQSLIEPDGSDGRPLGTYRLAASLYHDANRDMVADVPQSLLRCALHGGPLPDGLLFQAVKRNRAEQGITRPRAVLIKTILASQAATTEEADRMADEMKELDVANTRPAYLCGRLLAELEQAQRHAIPGINATLVDKYFGTASSAPASVFGNLLRDAQAHLSKLRKIKGKENVSYAIEGRIMDIVERLPEFPKTLNMKDQAWFGLGYYHQKAEGRATARAHKEAKTQSQTEEN